MRKGRPRKEVPGKKLNATLSQDAYRRLGFVAKDLGCSESKVLDAMLLAYLPPCSPDRPGLVSFWSLPEPVFTEEAGQQEWEPPVLPMLGGSHEGVVAELVDDGGGASVSFNPTHFRAWMTKKEIKRGELAPMVGVGVRRIREWVAEGRMPRERWERLCFFLNERRAGESF